MKKVTVRMERAGIFHAEQAKSALELLHVRGMPPRLRPVDRLNVLNTMVGQQYFTTAAELLSSGAHLWRAALCCSMPLHLHVSVG